ncbi:Nitrogen fixation protein VnfA [Allorhodopirellula solitaria]|uniref:Nitrogen fixation protein VnfA n=2 Tax=Allorhodopirellula solitaria TaxID=2527987 RepID=A0A5C5XNP5_9BACT|nr:Nitrogen fixation protein VnfA [Allorhodopirellula solitaria]
MPELLRLAAADSLAGRQKRVAPGSTSGSSSGSSLAASELGWRCGVVRQHADHWVTDYWTGDPWPLSHELASDATDRGAVVVQGEFAAVPIEEHPIDGDGGTAMPNMAMLLSIDGRPGDSELLAAMGQTLSQLFVLRRDRQDNTRRLWQTTRMLQAAAQWQQVDNDQTLLEAIARCACDVLTCERATIFLWDKPGQRLIGRPAIGIEGGVLEVADNVGIVGEVLRSASPRCWAASSDEDERVNRRVDRAQSFQTHSLAAVPMVNSQDQIVGVFEAINACGEGEGESIFAAADVHTLSELARHAVVAIDSQRTRAELTRTRDHFIAQAVESIPLIGDHEVIGELRNQAAKVAVTELSVLILGQNGTGKEVLAQQVHYQSERRNGPFIAVNCAAIVESLLESELFGHEKGSFTDASTARPGKFELAHGGTLFLDEIGDMSLGGQAKLLRVLEERAVVRVGGSQSIPVDTRVIAATNQPLQALIAAKRFREDLFFRLNVVSLTLPPLAERGNDVILLAEHFLNHFCRQIGRPVPVFDDAAQRAMLAHPWPGNVRELRNAVERVSYLSTGKTVGQSDLMLRSGVSTAAPATERPGGTGSGRLSDVTREFQVAHIESAIAQCGGNMSQAAKRLGLHRANLYRKMNQLGMTTPE